MDLRVAFSKWLTMRSPIERMIDEACGFDPDAPEPKRDLLNLRCPQCSKVFLVDRSAVDPPGAAVIECPCLDCRDHDPVVRWFNAEGRELDFDGKLMRVKLDASR